MDVVVTLLPKMTLKAGLDIIPQSQAVARGNLDICLSLILGLCQYLQRKVNRPINKQRGPYSLQSMGMSESAVLCLSEVRQV